MRAPHDMLVYHRPIKKGDKINIKKEPWPTAEFAAGYLKYLNKILEKDLTVLEFGSGGSSIYIANRVKSLVTHEHDPVWLEVIKNIIEEDGIENIDIRFDKNYENNFKCSEGKFDIASVDFCCSPKRDKSIINAMKCVKKGGLLIFHKGPGFKDERIYPILKKRGWVKIKQWKKWKDVWRLNE